jgi:type IV secretion system protein VirB5
MRRMKGMVAAMLVLASVLGAPAANAGIPVIDAANLAQAVQQVVAWGQQQLQMVTQINNQVQHYKAITGSRNLGQSFNNLQLQQIVSGNMPNVMSAINSQGFSGLTPQAVKIRNQTAIYNCMDKAAGVLRTGCQAALSTSAQAQADAATALSTAQQRVTEIQNIQNQINGTTDPKAIAEVHAALAAEQAQVQNDALRYAVAKQLEELQAKQAEQAFREDQLNKLSANAPSSFDNWSFP